MPPQSVRRVEAAALHAGLCAPLQLPWERYDTMCNLSPGRQRTQGSPAVGLTWHCTVPGATVAGHKTQCSVAAACAPHTDWGSFLGLHWGAHRSGDPSTPHPWMCYPGSNCSTTQPGQAPFTPACAPFPPSPEGP